MEILNWKEGYRDGVDAGKEASLQEGFNQGYKQGAQLMVKSGQLRGTLSALLSWCRLQETGCALLARISSLLEAVGRYEEQVLRRLSSFNQQPQPAELLDAVQDMDLSNDTAQQEERTGSEDRVLNEQAPALAADSVKSSAEAALPNSESHKMTEECKGAEQNLNWLIQQTACLMEQLSISADVVQQVQQLEN
ncbi:protein YAE1 homolog isoform X2 [Microcaecilia unicolor]|uniref:Protein YAE1 homolog isoform X2 n=1 Tax=Microcaecilia unicolor TaxID=1415580 RepID=A0A6P7XGG5_9AMPH|nr:protein YAE1 homolog isoform X2 [Microcaecilia unicolor]